MTWSRLWQLEKGEEVRGVAAHGGEGERLAVDVDPPFIAPRAGWYLCTIVDGAALFAPSEPDPTEHTVLPFAGRDAVELHDPIDPFVWPVSAEEASDPDVKAWIEENGIPEAATDLAERSGS